MFQTIVTLAEQPELEAQIPNLHRQSWPAFLQADPVAEQHWGALFATFAEYQYLLCNEQGTLIAAGHSVPLVWDGTIEGLPTGWDAALVQAFHDASQGCAPTVLCGLSIVIAPEQQKQGLSELMVQAMKDMAELNNLAQIIVPLRPTRKSMYPLIPMQRYMQWRRSDGTPFDPWLRLHQRLGAKVLSSAPRSMVITGTVMQWEQWTQMRFPESGTYTVPDALEPIIINCEQNYGCYEETNIWIRYD